MVHDLAGATLCAWREPAILGGADGCDNEVLGQRVTTLISTPYLGYWSRGSGDWNDCLLDAASVGVAATLVVVVPS